MELPNMVFSRFDWTSEVAAFWFDRRRAQKVLFITFRRGF